MTWTHEQCVRHNQLHEELLICGYDFQCYEESWEDYGTGETGPMVQHTPAYYEYWDGRRRIYTEAGVVMHTELYDAEFEAALEKWHAERT